MSYIRIEDALDRMNKSSAHLAAMPFSNTHSFSRALEPHHLLDLLREAEPHELSLFQNDGRPGASELVAEQLERLRHGRSISGKWSMPKGRGPMRRSMPDQPSPLKRRNIDKDDPENYIVAAARLLDVYHLPRAKEHVARLAAEYERLVDSLTDLEAERDAPSSDTIAAMEAAIKREELEIIALRDANSDLQKKIELASQMSAQSGTKLPARTMNSAPAPAPSQPESTPPPAPDPVPEPVAATPDAPVAIASLSPSPAVTRQESQSPRAAPQPLASQADADAAAALCWSKLASVLLPLGAEASDSVSAGMLISLLSNVCNRNDVPPKDRAEYALVRLMLEAYTAPGDAAPLHGQLVDPATRTGATPMFPMNSLKDALNSYCLAAQGIDRETASQLPTKAIYVLVGKSLLRIDRRSKNALVYFAPSE